MYSKCTSLWSGVDVTGWVGFAWGNEKRLRNSECPLTTSSRCIFAPISIENRIVLMTSVRRILTQPVILSTAVLDRVDRAVPASGVHRQRAAHDDDGVPGLRLRRALKFAVCTRNSGERGGCKMFAASAGSRCLVSRPRLCSCQCGCRPCALGSTVASSCGADGTRHRTLLRDS